MAERPDLDAVRRRHDEILGESDLSFEHRVILGADLEGLFTYCRELEAENKRLGELAEVDMQTREQMLRREGKSQP